VILRKVVILQSLKTITLKHLEIMKNYIALSYNPELKEANEVYVIAKNLKEAKSKVINCICISALNGTGKINF
jgi:hypothetical protein